MRKAIAIYESKWGNTQKVAEAIVEGMNQIEGIETQIAEVKDVEPTQVKQFDTILIGSANHAGRSTRNIKKFIDKFQELDLTNKRIVVFDTTFQRDLGKTVKNMEKQIADKAPNAKIVSPGLSICVNGFKGPVSSKELGKSKEFGAKIASLTRE